MDSWQAGQSWRVTSRVLPRFRREQFGKRLELLKELVPCPSRLAFLTEPIAGATSGNVAVQAGAQALGLQLQIVEARGADDLDAAFASMAEQRAEAVLLSSTAAYHNRVRIAELALQRAAAVDLALA